MTLRADIVESLQADLGVFRDRVPGRFDGDWLHVDRLRRTGGPTEVEGIEGVPEYETLTPVQQDLVWRLWLFDDAPVGLTLAGPAFQDNPVIYATRTLRAVTGYSLSTLRGENLRLLQGPATETEAVARLREAIDSWTQATVELWNYRRDGTPFRNRVSLVPVVGASGTTTNWLGVQSIVDPEEGSVPEPDPIETNP